MQKHIFAIVAVSLLSACSTTNVGLKYTSPAQAKKVAVSDATIFVGTFLDQREDKSNWLGAIRGGYGNPLKNLESDQPVADLVKAAFADGLRARGIVVGDSGKTQLTGLVKKLECNQYVRREAYADIEISVLDISGQQRFARTYSASNVEGSLLSLKTGLFASVDDLRVLLEKTLREAVDKALDDTALKAALQL